jgi:hypothetical protein
MTQLTRKEALDLSALVGLTPRELKSLRPDALARFEAMFEPRASDEAGIEAADEAAVSTLDPNLPIRQQPQLRELVELTEVHALAAKAGIPERAVSAAIDPLHSLTALDDERLTALVSEGRIRETDARRIGRLLGLYYLLDRDIELVQAIDGEGLDFRALAANDAKGWRALLARLDGSRSRRGSALSADAAEVFARRFAALHPTDALLGRLSRPRAKDISSAAADDSVELVQALHRANPGVELLRLDLSPASAELARLDLSAIPEERRARAISTLKRFRRAFALGRGVDGARALLEAGYGSASQVVRGGVDALARSTGLPEEDARTIYRNAVATVGAVTATLGTVADQNTGGFESLAVSNTSTDVRDYLRRLDGWAEMFGDQAACRCESCQSVLGPGAYFVDLMRFVERHVTEPFFTSKGLNDHVMNLKVRRPDLWTLELDCRNTDERIPTLRILGEVMENYVARRQGYAGDLGDRAAVEARVYPALATTVDSFRQPFTLPLERLEAYLRHFGQARASVADVLGASPAARAAARLGVSALAYEQIVTPAAALDAMKRIYAFAFVVDAAGFVADFDARALLRPTGLERPALGDVVATRFVQAGADGSLALVAGRGSADSVQNDVEHAHHFTVAALDRMHRFTRLLARVPWSVNELDQVIAALGGTLNAATTERVVVVLELQEELKITAEEACGMVADLPPALFDHAFNHPAFVAAGGRLPQAATFVHPAFRNPGATATDATLQRLLSGLRLDPEELVRLLSRLRGPLGFDPSAPAEAERGFPLSLRNLTLLWRHARLSARLRLPVDELFQLLEHALPAGFVDGVADLAAAVDFKDWLKESGYSLDDLGFVTGGEVRRPEAYPDPRALAETLRQEVMTGGIMVFADTVFAFDGLTEEQSRGVIAANSDRFRPAGSGSLRLAPTFNPASPLVVPAGIPTSGTALAKILGAFHVSTVLPARLSAHLGIGTEKMLALAALTGTDVTDPALAGALVEGGDRAPLERMIARLLPAVVVFRAAAWDGEALTWLRANRALFGVNDFTKVDITAVRRVSVYAALAAPSRDARGVTAAAASHPADLRHALEAFKPATGFAAANPARLGEVLGIDAALVPGLLAAVEVPQDAPEALRKLVRCAALARAIGVDPAALERIISADYATLDRAAGDVLAAFRTRYPDEKAWQEALDPLEERVLAARRDALVDYLIFSVHPEFETRRDLYHYFLVDVELEQGLETSRVLAAISSVQLYVHRIMLNLEQNVRGFLVPPDCIPRDEWAWRKNYRVWEANRKVFLYPENYLEPGLRDDKTPLFEALESELLQAEIDDQHVLDAYGSYLTGFDELVGLEIGGVYHDVDHVKDRDVLHLFGVTPSDPPVWYYRSVENAYHAEVLAGRGMVWSPWRKVELAIPVRHVSPVVYEGRLHVFWTTCATQPKTDVVAGETKFKGYHHKMTIRFTTLRLDGTWTAPQDLSLDLRGGPFTQGAGIVYDLNSAANVPRLSPDARTHTEPMEGYTLQGPNWEEIHVDVTDVEYPGQLNITARNFLLHARVDLVKRSVLSPRTLTARTSPAGQPPLFCARPTAADDPTPMLHAGVPTSRFYGDNAVANLVLDQGRMDYVKKESFAAGQNSRAGLYTRALFYLFGARPRLMAVNGSPQDVVLHLGEEIFLLQGSVRDGDFFRWRRLGTMLGKQLPEKLFRDGVDGLLATSYQTTLKEGQPAASPYAHGEYAAPEQAPDYRGPYGTYYREVFFHIPLLLATHLNGQGRYAAAQRWFHYLFDPTAHAPIGAFDTPVQRQQKIRDRVWRYREFRGLGIPKLRDILTDSAALEQYRTNPFNPHAIARLRVSGYQKAVVMRYLDNLLDWGDSLFAQFTPEAVNEATLLYAMAADILGERPMELGACGTGAEPRTYETIAPLLRDGSDFLVEMETMALSASATTIDENGTPRIQAASQPGSYDFVVDATLAGTVIHRTERTTAARATRATASAEPAGVAAAVSVEPAGAVALADADRVQVERIAARPAAPSSGSPARGVETAAAPAGIFRGTGWKETRIAGWSVRGHEPVRLLEHAHDSDEDGGSLASFGLALAEQVSPAFTIPANRELHAYWDRVEDRLYKIRHGLDISGGRRELPLFAPEIDPRLLVRMRAAGLTLEDVLGVTSGNLPPYRFAFLIERAKQAAGTVQGFGAALLAALEKKDAEELARLRVVHQQHLHQLTTRVREWEIEAAEDAIEALERQKSSAEFRRDYHARLAEEGRNRWESVQSGARHTASVLQAAPAGLNAVAGISHLIPQVGSPFAMTFGGVQVGQSATAWAEVARDLARAAEAVAASTGLEAGFGRRTDGWEHLEETADREVKQLEKQLEAANIRKDIAVRSLEIHQKGLEQLDEVFDFFGEKFTGLGLFTWMAATLQRLYREAYSGAFTLARLAEQAFRFERGDEGAPALGGGYWDAGHAGLLAGERLQVHLQTLERRFLETNYRSLELDQAFSLSQIDPIALLRLQEDGSCEFELPELFFDLAYPGQYQRKIRSVRLTIPCITGPYTNVGATLSLLDSRIRMEPKAGAAHLRYVPPRRSVSVATSTAQNDGGVFEMSFRDERYMPFEGAGAISRWRLSLPRSFRPFDYATINDVILHVAYTAEEDGVLRQAVEAHDAGKEGTLFNHLANRPLTRLFSLRQDFSSVFQRLLHSRAATPAVVELTPRHYPLFLTGRPLRVAEARLVLRTAPGTGVSGVRLAVDGTERSTFVPDPQLGGFPVADVTDLFAAGAHGSHTIAVLQAGPLAPDAPQPGSPSALDEEKLQDVMLQLRYIVAAEA